jgi:hypothetical protein
VVGICLLHRPVLERVKPDFLKIGLGQRGQSERPENPFIIFKKEDKEGKVDEL